jgi:diguanylate cyclase (GGDEF)-like protein
LGVLHVRGGSLDADDHAGGLQHLLDSEQRLAATVADQIALALANLRLRESLRAQSIRDPLTGVFNRRYMEESLERELRRAARRGYPISVIMLDVDHFTRVNETAGREAGDALLRGLGEFLRARIRKEDIACRFEGGEFALILPEAPLDVARERAEFLRDGFKRLDVTHRGKPVGDASLSLGVAVAPQHGSTTEALLQSAETALRRAKDGGRDRVTTAA